MTDPRLVAFGQLLWRLRKEHCMSQECLVERAGLVSVRYLQDLEYGKKQPCYCILGKLRKGLGCTWDELMALNDGEGGPRHRNATEKVEG